MPNLDKEIDEILNKYVSNYNLDVLDFRQSGQATVIKLLKSLIADREKKMLEFVIKYIRTGEVAGSFSEGCDCEKYDKYAKKVEKDLRQRAKEWEGR